MSGSRMSSEAVARDREQSRLRAAARREANRDKYNAEMRAYRAKNNGKINEDRRAWYAKYFKDELLDHLDREFIGWDGEGYSIFVVDSKGTCDREHYYMLFGCSRYLANPLVARSLSTEACLDYLLEVERLHPRAFHVGFSFNYDVNMILRDLPESTLRHLSAYGICHWHGYRIQYIRDKIFTVSRKKPEQIAVTVYDCFGFFNTSFVNALLKYNVATKQELSTVIEGKDKRQDFGWLDAEYVQSYWTDEIGYLSLLMDKLREVCYDAGLYITAWHGSGALASYMIRQRGVKKWKSDNNPSPMEVQIATQYAYAGGRFQPWKCGLYSHPVYTADLNSAYIYACSLLPRLDNGRWRRVPGNAIDRGNIARFGLYRIAFDARTTRTERIPGTHGSIYPLFHRDKYNNVRWPFAVEGWYWSPEAQTVANDNRARFLEAWVYDDDGSYPFGWVHEVYDQRLILQHQGNPAEKALKWALAAMYGAYARRVGWDRKRCAPPRSHELAWAGFITSWCRAQMYLVGYECWKRDALISIDTDGVTSQVPFESDWLVTGVGEKLGQWKLESFAGILYWQTGVYWLLHDNGQWDTAKTRGIPRGTTPVEVALSALSVEPRKPEFTRHKQRFVGFKDALNRGNISLAFKWETIEDTRRMGHGVTYKHVRCAKCNDLGLDQMHTLFHPIPNDTMDSKPHRLPWLEEQAHLPENLIEMDMEDSLSTVHDADIPDRL